MKSTLQKRATIVSSSVATVLVLLKVIIGLASGSVAVLASAIDSLLDMGVSLFNYFALSKSEEDPDDNYQYGKGKVQAIAAVIEGTIIIISGIIIITIGIEKLIDGSGVTYLTPSIIVMVISLVITYFLVRYLQNVAQETDNLVIKADALHYKTDLWSNAAVLLSLLLVYMTQAQWIDAIFGMAIGMYIIYSAYEIIVEGIEILLDRALNADTVLKIREIISNHSGITSYHWLKTRTDGTTNFIEFHMVLHPKILLLEAHVIADEVEEEIQKLDNKKSWVITPHFDPYDDEGVNNAMLYGKKLIVEKEV